MTIELSMLAWSSVLLIVLIMTSANANLATMGMAWGIGNRDEPSAATGWGARARRTYLNHLENLVIFGLLVIVAHLTNVHSGLTSWGRNYSWAHGLYMPPSISLASAPWASAPWLILSVWSAH